MRRHRRGFPGRRNPLNQLNLPRTICRNTLRASGVRGADRFVRQGTHTGLVHVADPIESRRGGGLA